MGLREAVARAALAVLFWALRVLPKNAFPALAWVITCVLWPVSGKERRRLRENVRRIYGVPGNSHFGRMFGWQVLHHQVITALETLRIIDDPADFDIVGESEVRATIQAAEAPGKGHVVITAHLGAWELCAYLGRKHATRPFHVLAKPSRSAALTTFLDRIRRRMGVDVLWTDRKTLLRAMLTALRCGESVGFVMDQKPEGRKGPEVPFFGIPTAFVSGPASMACRTGCAVVALFCLREGAFRYRVVSRLIVPADGETDEAALTAVLAREIESVIRLYPEQWTWSYKRWKWPEASELG